MRRQVDRVVTVIFLAALLGFAIWLLVKIQRTESIGSEPETTSETVGRQLP